MIKFKKPVSIRISPDGAGFHSTLSIPVPLYGYGNTVMESISMLYDELDSYYKDLSNSQDSELSSNLIKDRSIMQEYIK